jgi:hypothetical protein
MTGWVWAGIIIGLVIVALAVGIPYFLTHRTMHDPYDRSEGRAYLEGKRRWLRHRTQAGLPKQAARKRRVRWYAGGS